MAPEGGAPRGRREETLSSGRTRGERGRSRSRTTDRTFDAVTTEPHRTPRRPRRARIAAVVLAVAACAHDDDGLGPPSGPVTFTVANALLAPVIVSVDGAPAVILGSGRSS